MQFNTFFHCCSFSVCWMWCFKKKLKILYFLFVNNYNFFYILCAHLLSRSAKNTSFEKPKIIIYAYPWIPELTRYWEEVFLLLRTQPNHKIRYHLFLYDIISDNVSQIFTRHPCIRMVYTLWAGESDWIIRLTSVLYFTNSGILSGKQSLLCLTPWWDL